MEPFDLNAIEVNVEIDQSDSPVHIIWNDGRVFDIVSYGAVVPCPSKTGPELATVRDVFIAVGHGKTTTAPWRSGELLLSLWYLRN